MVDAVEHRGYSENEDGLDADQGGHGDHGNRAHELAPDSTTRYDPRYDPRSVQAMMEREKALVKIITNTFRSVYCIVSCQGLHDKSSF